MARSGPDFGANVILPRSSEWNAIHCSEITVFSQRCSNRMSNLYCISDQQPKTTYEAALQESSCQLHARVSRDNNKTGANYERNDAKKEAVARQKDKPTLGVEPRTCR
jgi:hypothetical protein